MATTRTFGNMLNQKLGTGLQKDPKKGLSVWGKMLKGLDTKMKVK